MAAEEPAPEAVLEQAEPAGQEAEEARTQLSADGSWWWDGERWVPALSPDGLWRWDGAAWRLASDLDTSDPWALVDGLDRLVDAGFAEGGHILSLRAHEWRARDPELAELVQRAAPLAVRLAALDGQLAGLDGAGGILALRHLLGGGEREQLEAEARRIEAELRPLAALIGRMAPQPTLKEADEVIGSARRLSQRVVELSTAVAEERRLEAEQEDQVTEARGRLERAREEREGRLRELEERVREREQEHARAVDGLTQALRQVRVPPAGEPQASFAGAVLRENRVDTPDGRGPLEGATAAVATASELWDSERETVDALGLVEAAHAARLHDALVGGSDELFLLVRTSHACSLLPVAAGQEEEAREFAAALGRAARGARRRRADWEAKVAAAEAALQAALADRVAVDEVRSAFEAAAGDPELNRTVEAAEAELDRAQARRPEQEAARARMEEIAERLLEPPPALA